GLAFGRTVRLNDNAAGWGWFIDPTPADDSEFLTPGDQGEQRRTDLLNVLEHEVDQPLGKADGEGGVVAEALNPGTRRTPFTGSYADWLATVDVLFAE